MFESKRLETERLILRPMTAADFDDFLDYYIDLAAADQLGGYPVMDEAGALCIFREHCAADLTWAIERKSDGRVIGDVHFGDVVDAYLAQMGYLIHRDERGHGYAREAVSAAVAHVLSETSIGRIRAIVLTHNKASLCVLEGCGFCREAMLYDGDYGGRVADVYYYSMTKANLPLV